MTYLDALQTTLAAEHATLFVGGYLGAQTSASADPTLYEALRTSYDVHRARRDELTAFVVAEGGEPVAAEASYDLPGVVTGDSAAIRAEALRVEQACGTTYGYLVANAPSEQRRWAVDVLVDSARRELALGGSPRPSPGR
ncbi:DUF4439 domain-containing protein [Nocardioides sp. 1609]|uniref:DUF4439 domain-containing protein n=1 Tax=Nocardioides sp. 1609 TaxID=2508327 RepID=UPI001430C775|nr:DUF4439 domain-containing protein [Nocardioides sp. 1609]